MPRIMPGTFRAVIFDLDGTLVGTAGEIALALDRTLADLGRESLPRATIEALIGRGVRSLVERALGETHRSDVDLHRAVERFEHHYATTVGTAAALYPGVLPGLHLFHDAGIRMAVATNKPRSFTLRLLDRLELKAFFAAIVAGDDGVRRKPHGDMLLAACKAMHVGAAATVMIGDSENDVLAARAAGCEIWCVPYGYNEGRSPDTLQCDRRVASVDEAAKVICSRGIGPPPSRG